MLHTIDDAGVRDSLCGQFEEFVVFDTDDSPRGGGKFQMNRIVSPQGTANAVDAMTAQLRDYLR